MVEKTVRESQGEIQATGDAIVLAEAVYNGLIEIADAIREVGKMLNEGENVEEPVEFEKYLDGTRAEKPR